jgi:hypothetical protein
VLALDVTKAESITAALDASGPIDVLVNSASIGLFGAFEATPMATVRVDSTWWDVLSNRTDILSAIRNRFPHATPSQDFLKDVYRIAAVRRQDQPWHIDGIIGNSMPLGSFVTLDPPPSPPGTDHCFLGVEVKVDGVPSEFVAGRLEEDGRLCVGWRR